jgi:hypothetical protein
MFSAHFFVTIVYKKMPRACKYIQSFTRVQSVKTSIESGYVYQHYAFQAYRRLCFRRPLPHDAPASLPGTDSMNPSFGRKKFTDKFLTWNHWTKFHVHKYLQTKPIRHYGQFNSI